MAACPAGLVEGFGLDHPTGNAICAIRSYFGTNAIGEDIFWSGSGMLFATGNGRSAVATCAHNLFHRIHRRRAESLQLWFGRSGSTAAFAGVVQDFMFPDEFATLGAPPEWDFGVILVAGLDSQAAPPIPLAESTAAGETEKMIVGYPDEGVCKDGFQPFHAGLTVFPSSPVNYGYRGQPTNTYVGMSGGPLLGRPTANQLRSYGIHIRGAPDEHRAVRFSGPVLARMAAWVD